MVAEKIAKNCRRLLYFAAPCRVGMIADVSTAGVMEGQKYNCAVRLHKLLYEALPH